jgi:hypothetical protein
MPSYKTKQRKPGSADQIKGWLCLDGNAMLCKDAAKSNATFQIATKLWQNKNKKIKCHKTVAKPTPKLKLPQKHHFFPNYYLFYVPESQFWTLV